MKDDIYDPHDVDEVRSEQKLERKLYLFTCPLCKKESFALYRNRSYLECLNVDCRAIGVPQKNITKITISGKEINVFSPNGFKKII
jgi:hypothetical protein